MGHNGSSRHILSLSPLEKKTFVDSFNIVLSDCDGVIWPLNTGTIPDANKGINAFKQFNKKCKFVSNNSLRSDEEYLHKFAELGILNVKAADIIHPAKIVSYYLKLKQKNPNVYSLACENFNNHLLKNGITIVKQEVEDHWTFEKFEKMADKIDTAGVNAVVFDIDLNLTYPKLVEAEQYLKNPNVDLIVGATEPRVLINKKMDMFCTRLLYAENSRLPLLMINKNGKREISFTLNFVPYSFLPMLCRSTGKVATVLGKPSISLGQYVVQRFSIKSPKNVLLIGDSITSDIKFGNSCGFQTMLVLSGVTSMNMLKIAKDDMLPNYYANSLAEIPLLFADIENCL